MNKLAISTMKKWSEEECAQLFEQVRNHILKNRINDKLCFFNAPVSERMHGSVILKLSAVKHVLINTISILWYCVYQHVYNTIQIKQSSTRKSKYSAKKNQNNFEHVHKIYSLESKFNRITHFFSESIINFDSSA